MNGCDDNNGRDFTPPTSDNWKYFQMFLRYTQALFKISREFLLDLTSSNNKSIVSKVVKICITVISYAVVYTNVTGKLLLALSFLAENRWYILVGTVSSILLLGSAIVLASYEWMWRWQDQVIELLEDGASDEYDAIIAIHESSTDNNRTTRRRRRRIITILDDDDMEEDLSLKTWIKKITFGLCCCLLWSLYCFMVGKIDFWITDQFIHHRPEFTAIELQLIHCIEALPVLLGTALFLYYACPTFYYYRYWERSTEGTATTSSSSTVSIIPSADEDDDGGNLL